MGAPACCMFIACQSSHVSFLGGQPPGRENWELWHAVNIQHARATMLLSCEAQQQQGPRPLGGGT